MSGGPARDAADSGSVTVVRRMHGDTSSSISTSIAKDLRPDPLSGITEREPPCSAAVVLRPAAVRDRPPPSWTAPADGDSSACGILLQGASKWDAEFRVTRGSVESTYRIDRWD